MLRKTLLILLGAGLGALVGAVLGILLSMLYIELTNMSCREGACGMMVFFGAAPLGLIIGTIVGGLFTLSKVR